MNKSQVKLTREEQVARRAYAAMGQMAHEIHSRCGLGTPEAIREIKERWCPLKTVLMEYVRQHRIPKSIWRD